MPVPTNNSRPSLPYQPTQSLPNNARFDILTTTQRPPTAEMLDAEFNALTDDVNMLAAAINDVQAGTIPGSDTELNANKLLKTDGAGNLSWTLITNTELAPGAVVEQGLGLQSVTTPKIGDAAVTNAKISLGAVTTDKIDTNAVTSEELAPNAVITEKLSDNAVTTPKLADGAVTTPKLALQAVTQAQIADLAVGTPQLIDGSTTRGKLADQSVTNPKIGLLAVTAPQISSANAAIGTVLTSGAGSEVIWSAIPTTGKILQIVPLVYAQTTLNEYDALCSPTNLLSFKSGALAVTVTPLKSGNESTILIYYGLTLGGRASGGGDCAVTLCKNASIFSAGSKGVTHFCSYNGNLNSDAVFTCANLFTDKAQISGTPITYELKKALPYTNINSSYSGGAYGSFVSTMIVVEVQI